MTGVDDDDKMRRLFEEWRDEIEAKGVVVAYREDRGFFYTLPREGIDNPHDIPVRRP